MKVFFHKLWKVLLLIVSPLIFLFRGRSVSIVFSEHDEVKSPADEEILCDPWLDKIERLSLRVLRGKCELIIALPYTLAGYHFRDLYVTLVLKNGVTGFVHRVRIEGFRSYGHRLHILPLESTNQMRPFVAMKRTNSDSGYAINVARIELEIGGRRKSFFYEERTGFFYPTTQKTNHEILSCKSSE